MRVLHVIPSISSRRGGPSAAIFPMVRALRARGVEAEIATTDEDIEELPAPLPDVPVRFFPRRARSVRFLREYLYSPRFASWLEESITGYDLIHAHAIFSHLPTWAMTRARRRGIPYLSRPLGQLGVWPLRQSALRKRLYLRLIEAENLRHAAALHFTSESERREASLAGFDSPGVVVPHGIDVPDRIPDARDRLRRELGLAAAARIVLHLGRIHRKKGLDLLVGALAKMNRPDVFLALAGEGPDRSGIEGMARQLGLDRQVRWLGHVEGPRKQICLQGADLFALASRHENFGLAVLEALAAGTPVVISDQVALAGDIAANEVGRIAPLDASAFATQITQGLAEPPSEVVRQERRRFVASRYAWAANAEALDRVYRDVLQNRTRRSGIAAPKTGSRKIEMKSLTTYAPGRAELLGNHTDYNEGYVLAIAVDHGTTLTGQVRPDRMLRLRSREMNTSEEISLDHLAAEKVADWARYTLGVVDQFRRHELPLGGFDAEISSTLPMGAGLSSSASLENAAVLFLLQAFGGKLTPLQMAQYAQMAEHDFVGVRCGLLDQIASLMSKAGSATFIDCRTFEVRHVPIPDNVSFILAQSGVKHSLVAGEYNERRSDCEAAARALGVKALRDVTTEMLLAHQHELPERIFKRARHITGENERVLAVSEALKKGDLARFGRIMFESHESSRVYFENSCPELDHLVDVARRTPGVYGARLSGGGFGGATINLVERSRVDEVVKALTAAAPGTACLVTKAADGALAVSGQKS